MTTGGTDETGRPTPASGPATIVVARGSLGALWESATSWDTTATFVEADLNTDEQVAAATREADGVIVTLQRLSAAAINSMGASVRVIGRAGVGVDAIDLQAARDRGIAVINQPAYAVAEVATHAVSMALAVHRRLLAADSAARDGWASAPEIGTVAPLTQATAGVVGAGRIGRAVIERLCPFVDRVLVFDPALGAPIPGAQAVDSLEELLRESDLVSLHLPLLDSTRHMLDAGALATMRPGSILVNVSRGGLVDEDALASALTGGHLSGAALDVFETEPLAAESAILDAPNVLLSPHIAWYSTESVRRLSSWTVDDVVKYLGGRDDLSGMIVNA